MKYQRMRMCMDIHWDEEGGHEQKKRIMIGQRDYNELNDWGER